MKKIIYLLLVVSFSLTLKGVDFTYDDKRPLPPKPSQKEVDENPIFAHVYNIKVDIHNSDLELYSINHCESCKDDPYFENRKIELEKRIEKLKLKLQALKKENEKK